MTLLTRLQAPRRAAQRANAAAEQLLMRARPHRPRRLTSRERRVEATTSAAFLLVAVAMAVVLDSTRSFSLGLAGALVVVHAVASRVRVHVGAGYVMPTQLVIIPMLFVLPAASVPLLVAAGLASAAAVDVLRGRSHHERMMTGCADAWHAVGASLVLALAGEPEPRIATWPIVVLALVAHSVLDVLSATVREWLGRGIRPTLHAGSLLVVPLIDLALTPVAMITAAATAAHPASIITVVPLLALLAALSADRRHRIEEAVSRLDALRAEEARLDRAVGRIGEAFASNLNSTALLELALRTAVEAFAADRGRAGVGAGAIEMGASDPELDAALAAAEDAARGRRSACDTAPGAASFALSQPLADATVLAIARRERPFSDDEQRRFGSLVRQVGVAIENAALHDQLRRQATTDELTGLANHRRFQEVLGEELRRTARSGRPFALVMLDIDNFKSVNDTYGHQQGDVVLRAVGAALRRACRVTDEPARYGGEELAAVLRDTDLDGACIVAEGIRRAVQELKFPLDDDSTLGVTVSVGVSAVGPGWGDARSMIAAADAALYQAKRCGKNRVVSAPRSYGRFTPSTTRAATA